MVKLNPNNIYVYYLVNATPFVHWSNPDKIIKIIKSFS